MEVRGEAQVRCGKCGAVVYISGDYLTLEQTWGDERAMGAELGYEGFCETHCAHCKNPIVVNYEATEYPEGFVNSAEADITGGTLIKGFSGVEIAYIDEIYSLYTEETNIILPKDKKIILPGTEKIITRLETGVDLLIKEIIKDPASIRKIDPRRFEELIAHIFSLAGFSVELTKQTRDGGKDIVAIRDDLGIRSQYIIECKRYAEDNPVSVELVRALHGVQTSMGANKAVLATTSTFTNDARKFAETKNTVEWSMSLKEYDDVIRWVQDAKRIN